LAGVIETSHWNSGDRDSFYAMIDEDVHDAGGHLRGRAQVQAVLDAVRAALPGGDLVGGVPDDSVPPDCVLRAAHKLASIGPRRAAWRADGHHDDVAGDARGDARAPALADGQPRPDEAFDVA